MAKGAGLPHREFVSAMSKEFTARCMTDGYLNCEHGVFSCKGKRKRPVMMKLHCVEGYDNRYIWEMMHIGELSDEELFGANRNIDRSERRIVRKHGAIKGRI